MIDNFDPYSSESMMKDIGDVPLHILEGKKETLEKYITERVPYFTGLMTIQHPTNKLIRFVKVGKEVSA